MFKKIAGRDVNGQLVSIPQAVGTIAIETLEARKLRRQEGVSIPQAVGTIAIVADKLTFGKVKSLQFQYRKR